MKTKLRARGELFANRHLGDLLCYADRGELKNAALSEGWCAGYLAALGDVKRMLVPRRNSLIIGAPVELTVRDCEIQGLEMEMMETE